MVLSICEKNVVLTFNVFFTVTRMFSPPAGGGVVLADFPSIAAAGRFCALDAGVVVVVVEAGVLVPLPSDPDDEDDFGGWADVGEESVVFEKVFAGGVAFVDCGVTFWGMLGANRAFFLLSECF